jgi:type IX secretion system PorP/SprF family membrane protein
MKKLIFSIIVISLPIIMQAQMQNNHTHYFINPMLINPAYVGYNNEHTVLANGRNQWLGFPGAPNQYTLMYGGPVNNRLALGAVVASETVAGMNTSRLGMNYAFRFNLAQTKAAIGFGTEFQRSRLSQDWANRPINDLNDRTVQDALNGQNFFNANAGAFLTYNERLFGGLSLPTLIRARLNGIASANEAASSVGNNYIMYFGYKFDIGEQEATLTPSMAIRRLNGAPFQVDLNAKANLLNNKFIGGLTLRTGAGGAVGVLIGSRFNGLEAYYSFDIGFTTFQSYSTGSHEFTLAYNFKGKPKK